MDVGRHRNGGGDAAHRDRVASKNGRSTAIDQVIFSGLRRGAKGSSALLRIADVAVAGTAQKFPATQCPGNQIGTVGRTRPADLDRLAGAGPCGSIDCCRGHDHTQRPGRLNCALMDQSQEIVARLFRRFDALRIVAQIGIGHASGVFGIRTDFEQLAVFDRCRPMDFDGLADMDLIRGLNRKVLGSQRSGNDDRQNGCDQCSHDTLPSRLPLEFTSDRIRVWPPSVPTGCYCFGRLSLDRARQ